ncbi:MAG: hypothetical protein H7A38_06935 [Chlamydiales bacterium]|nr:hypothetical protein [Chlamydiales bacterium]
MKGLIVGLLLTGTLWAAAHEEYIPCEKTYIDPNVVDLHEKKIKVQEGEEIYQTSAIYSDKNGLFYKDYLQRYEEEEETVALDLAFTDQQIDPMEHIPPPQETLLYTDQMITQREPAPPPSQPTPKTSSPLPQRGAWPYTNKRR